MGGLFQPFLGDFNVNFNVHFSLRLLGDFSVSSRDLSAKESSNHGLSFVRGLVACGVVCCGFYLKVQLYISQVNNDNKMSIVFVVLCFYCTTAMPSAVLAMCLPTFEFRNSRSVLVVSRVLLPAIPRFLIPSVPHFQGPTTKAVFEGEVGVLNPPVQSRPQKTNVFQADVDFNSLNNPTEIINNVKKNDRQRFFVRKSSTAISKI